MHNWFECKVSYEKMLENGMQKKVTEQCNQMQPPVRALFTTAEYEGVWICSAEIPSVAYR